MELNFEPLPDLKLEGPIASEPKEIVPDKTSKVKSDARKEARDLASIQNLDSGNDLARNDEARDQKPAQVLQSFLNGIKKAGSTGLKVAGFGGFSVAALLYTFFNSKVFASIFAAPSLGAFYIAHNLKKSAKNSSQELGLTTDVNEIIAKARDNSSFLEKNFAKVTAAMVKLGSMSDSNSKKYAGLKDLKAVANKVKSKLREVSRINNKSPEIAELEQFIQIHKDLKATIDPKKQEIYQLAA